jgi:hypothetical protein
MKTLLFVLLFASAGFTYAKYPKAYYDAIEAVNNAREALVADLENDQGHNVRGMWGAAPMDFDKVLKDEEIYNTAVRVFDSVISGGDG